jgi:hypothetical protein
LVNEGDSKTDKNYPKFDGKSHVLQKSVKLVVTISSKYQAKVGRLLGANGINFELKIEAPKGRFYPDFDKNRAICFSKDVENDPSQWTPENAYLTFIAETHSRPEVQYFHLGQPISKEEAWTEKYIRPSGLNSNKKNVVKNSMFNKAMEAAAEAEQAGDIALAKKHMDAANRLAKTDDFKELEFFFRTVKLSNLIWVRVDGMEIHLED